MVMEASVCTLRHVGFAYKVMEWNFSLRNKQRGPMGRRISNRESNGQREISDMTLSRVITSGDTSRVQVE